MKKRIHIMVFVAALVVLCSLGIFLSQAHLSANKAFRTQAHGAGELIAESYSGNRSYYFSTVDGECSDYEAFAVTKVGPFYFSSKPTEFSFDSDSPHGASRLTHSISLLGTKKVEVKASYDPRTWKVTEVLFDGISGSVQSSK